MPTDYDTTTALHYAAYRPNLHWHILETNLGDARFNKGLDVGCGTGVSASALANFCDTVIGVDPSAAMLSKTVPTPSITYALMQNSILPFADDSFDICTYAGAWWYGKSQALLSETLRVMKPNSSILLYDFLVDLSTITTALGILPTDLQGYDHKANFESLDTSKIKNYSQATEEKILQLSPTQLGHLLCAELPVYTQLKKRFPEATFNSLVAQLSKIAKTETIAVTAYCYANYYTL